MLIDQTVRVWISRSCDDIMIDIRNRGLSEAVLEAVPLEDGHSTAHENVLGDRPKNMLMVDLAVVEPAITHVLSHFASVSTPLEDVSLVMLAEDPNDPERNDPASRIRRYFAIYSKYLQHQARAEQRGNTPNRVLNWYSQRVNEISDLAQDLIMRT